MEGAFALTVSASSALTLSLLVLAEAKRFLPELQLSLEMKKNNINCYGQTMSSEFTFVLDSYSESSDAFIKLIQRTC